jgi:hypothetical protein
VWIIILIFFLILCWFFFAPLQFVIDTRIPLISLRWFSIGKAILTFEDDKWFLRIWVLFFHKQWEVEKLFFKKKKIKRIKKPKQKRKRKFKWSKMFRALKTFRVRKYEIAIDTGDYVLNAWLYPLNFYPPARKHVHINFFDENYLVLEVRNIPWRLVYAFIK